MNVDVVTQNDLIQMKNEIVQEISNKIQSQSPNKWLRTAEVREMLSISPGTLQNMRTSGVIPFSKIGSTLFYSMEDIQSILEKSKSFSKS